MQEKNIFNHLKEQAQKATQSVAQTVKEMADESGLTSKEGREEILKKARNLANRTKQSIQDTAQRGASAAKSAIDKSVEKAQATSSQIKESIKSKKNVAEKTSAKTKDVQESVTPRPAENLEKNDSSTDEINKSFENSVTPQKIKKKKNMTQKKSSIKGPAILAAGLAVGGVGVGIGIGVDDADTHCAYFTLEEEYNLMKDCVDSCGNYISACAEKIRQFECREKMTYSKTKQQFDNSCPLYYK